MMHRRDAESQRTNAITKRVIGYAIDVHRALGPGLLESAYEECLCYELSQAHVLFHRQVALPVIYKGVRLDCGYRMDLVIVEIKAIDCVLSIHEAQLLTYLKLSEKSVGLLINFNVSGVKRRPEAHRESLPRFLRVSAPLR
jgi:GxxExxY protein